MGEGGGWKARKNMLEPQPIILGYTWKFPLRIQTKAIMKVNFPKNYETIHQL